MSRNATTYLTREEIRAFVTPDDAAGARAVLFTWGLIALGFAVLVAFPRAWLAYLVVVPVLGGRQLALAILMHECAHHSLFRSRRANELVGAILCAAPVWLRLDAYRVHHLAHHAHTSLPGDPDLGLVEPFPTTRAGLARKLLRDASGIAFLRRVVGTLGMDAGLLTYSASTGQRRVVPRPALSVVLTNLVRHTGPALLAQLVLLGALAAAGAPEVYLAWVLANAVPFSVFVRIRAIAEHAVTEATEDPFRSTRTTAASPLARLFVAPHRVNYHLEHHLLPTVPQHALPRLHALLRARGAYDDGATFAPGYLAVLQLASAGPRPGHGASPSAG